jgi:hypothetical protein
MSFVARRLFVFVASSEEIVVEGSWTSESEDRKRKYKGL